MSEYLNESDFKLTVKFVFFVWSGVLFDILFAHDIVLGELVVKVNLFAWIDGRMVVKFILISFIET